MLKNPNFPGLRPGPHWGNLLGELTLAYSPDLLAGVKGIRCRLDNNPTPVLGTSIRPRLRVLGLTQYSAGNRKCDYYSINTQ